MKLAQADVCFPNETVPADPRLSRAIMPSPAILEAAQAAPPIRFGRNEKGHVIIEGAHGAGWQIPLAVAAWSGSTAGDAKLLDQIELALNGSSTVVANGGYPAQHEQNITGMFAILRQSPRFWTSVLTETQRAKIDLVMQATLVASAYTTSDDSYVEGARATALDGDTNLHRHWNPNFREGMFGGLLVAEVYFGGTGPVRKFLDDYDHEAFTRRLKDAGLSNIYETFSRRKDHPDSGAPDAPQIEHAIRSYRYGGKPLMGPFDLYRELTRHTYGATVSAGLNRGRGIGFEGVQTGCMVSGAETLPNIGAKGMLREFDSHDALGPRSCIVYAYDGFRPNLTHQVVLLVGGYWPSDGSDEEVLKLIDVGIADLRYKLGHGYRSYAKGKGSHQAFDLNAPSWAGSFKTCLPYWTDILRPYHLKQP